MWQVSILTGAEGEEAVAQLLERTFQQAPTTYRNEKTADVVVTAYLKRWPRPRRMLTAELKNGLARLRQFGLDPGPARLTIRPLPRKNWAESWKRHFKPIDIAGRLLIKPSWSRRRPRRGRRVVVLDPGLSFGTGQHPTTLFCLEQLALCRKTGARQSFLDIGTGSGILAISAAKLGYSPVVAFDCDPEALRVSRQNINRNRVRVRLTRGDVARLPASDRGRYDVICANLISDLLLAHADGICRLLKPGGSLIVAGILGWEFQKIRKKFRQFSLTLRRSRLHKEWKSGRFALAWQSVGLEAV
jgi:ribosomal protein L11 methyltransferase